MLRCLLSSRRDRGLFLRAAVGILNRCFKAFCGSGVVTRIYILFPACSRGSWRYWDVPGKLSVSSYDPVVYSSLLCLIPSPAEMIFLGAWGWQLVVFIRVERVRMSLDGLKITSTLHPRAVFNAFRKHFIVIISNFKR